MAEIRGGGGPRFLHARTYRLTGHTASDAGSRIARSRKSTSACRDEPIRRLRGASAAPPASPRPSWPTCAETLRAEIEAAYANAKAAPYPEARDAFEDVQDIGDPRQEAF